MSELLQTFLVILCSLNLRVATGEGSSYPVGYHPYLHPHSHAYPHPHNAPTLLAVYAYPLCHPPPIPPKELESVLDFTKKIGDTVGQVGTTLTEIGQIALDDNPEIGAKIMQKLQDQVALGSMAMAEFAADSMTGRGKRSKRAPAMDGAGALSKVGDSLVKVMGMIDGDMKKLSQRAQDKISKKNKDALDKCRADSCKAASKLLADADDGERQK